MKANVYIDGFNLYYGCVKNTPYKWLNPQALCQRMFPHYQINRIRYFTARIRGTSDDPRKPQRQAIFIRALQTIPNLSVHYGHFLSHTVRMPLANPALGGARTVEVIKTEEKGSDVNLAAYLLLDGFDEDYDLAIIISNDSDLLEAIGLVQSRLGMPVAVLNPQRDLKKTSWALKNAAQFYGRIRVNALKASQFPATLSDSTGSFTKPKEW